MADNIKIVPSLGASDPPVATDDIGGVHYQKVKVGWGVDGAWSETTDADGVRLPVGGALIGLTSETAPASDTAAAGLNGRLQRIAQRLTSLIALLPASLGQKTMANGLAVTIASDQSTIPVSGTVTSNAGTNLNTSALLTQTDYDSLTGALTETAPATDIASSGLNGRLQRISQRLTSLIALLPTALTPAGALKDGSAESVLTASVASGATLQGTGTDLAGIRNWGLIVPSTFDGTQIQFQMSDTLAGTYVPVYDITNARVILTVAASRYYDIPGELMAVRFIKIECVTAQATTSTDFLIIGKS